MVKNVLNTLRKKQKNNKGFSLVELIVVIAIMVVLVGVLAPQFIKYVERSRQSTDLQNVEELKNAVEVEAADKGITTEAVITISKDSKGNFTAKLTGVDPESIGKKEVSLKSSGWKAQTYKYKPNTLKWETDAKDEDTKNTKDPNRDMADVFTTTGGSTGGAGGSTGGADQP